MNFRFVRHELGQDFAKAKRIFTQGRTHPFIAGGCRIPFIEDQVDDFEHTGQSFNTIGSQRDFKGDMRF